MRLSARIAEGFILAKLIGDSLKKLPLGAVRPDGWLLSEMKHMATLQRRLGALQGLIKDGEWVSGENLPRYVRGLVLLAGTLDDRALKDKIPSFVSPIFNSAKEGGDFGPKAYRSLTPKIEAVKTLLSYYELTADERVLPFLKKFFKNQFNTYTVSPCWYNSRARLLEEIPALEAVYRDTDLEWLQDLGEKLRDSSNDWFHMATKFPYKKPFNKYVSPSAAKRVLKLVTAYEKYVSENVKLKPLTPEIIEKQWKSAAHQTMVETDGVNLAKAVKYPAVYGRFVGDEDLKNLSLKLIDQLYKHHGTATGMFASDFRLAGANPSRGIDVQAAVEMIESLSEVIRETGSFLCADLLERIVFNVIPAACTESVDAVQDILLTNQVEVSDKRRLPNSDSEFSNAFLTKKHSRGAIAVLSAYPLYLQTACMVKTDEINFFSYTPCTMELSVGGNKLTISERTGYPFRNTVVFKVEQADGEPDVKINFRVPVNTTMHLISGGQIVASGEKIISVKCVLKKGSTFMLKMDMPLTVEENADGTYSLYKGNTLMSLKMPANIQASAEDRRVLCANFIKKWNVAPVVSRRAVNGAKRLYDVEKTIVNDIGEYPYSFEKPPFELKIRSKNVTNWDYDVNGFSVIPSHPIYSEESLERSFVPFGCAVLHMAQFPKCLK